MPTARLPVQTDLNGHLISESQLEVKQNHLPFANHPVGMDLLCVAGRDQIQTVKRVKRG
ncbi:hypothetical protein [Larkinella rosea]|uniref:hypothetical protein n=1 Tax=Larkinella rosea TaxID=2025312 RepID=UPI00163B59B1|nr:hypothetical protein [Larkinella rosea]